MLSTYAPLALVLGLLSSPLVAQSNYPNQSAPFALVLSSANETLNGAKLFSCHAGAAIEALCVDTSGARADEFETYYSMCQLLYI